MFEVTAFHHASLIVKDTDRALSFYVGLLGLETDDSRPDLGYPGAWLDINGQQIHLLELPNPDALSDRPLHGGRDRHLAFRITGIDKLSEKLASASIAFTRSKSGRKALFCRDPDGNALEFIESASL